MLKWLALFILGIAPLLGAQTVTLQGTIKNPDGTGFTGSVQISLARSSVVNTCASPAQVTSMTPVVVAVNDGVFTPTQVLPNYCMTPQLPYYVQVLDSLRRLVYTDNWMIPQLSGGVVNIGTLGAVQLASGITVSVPLAVVTTPSGNQTITQPAGTSLTVNTLNAGSFIATASLTTPGLSSDPASPSNGALWYNTASNSLKGEINGSAVSLGGGGAVTNPLTFNNGGSGASSGSSFNGSAPVTVSYNTIGAAPAVSKCLDEGATFTPVNGNCYVVTAAVSTAAPAASSFAFFTVTTSSVGSFTLTGATINDGGSCFQYISGTTLTLPASQSVSILSDGTNLWARCGMTTFVYANSFPGADIGAQINAAFTSCPNCTVYVTAGSYSFSTTINYPVTTYQYTALLLDSAAVLTYTGSTTAILAQPSAARTGMRVDISGGAILCQSTACRSASAIDMVATNGEIHGVMIRGFNSGGEAILLDGANTVHIHDNRLIDNSYDVYLAPYSSAALGSYAVNAVHIDHNVLAGLDGTDGGTAGWCVYASLYNVHGVSFSSAGQNNSIENNDLEACGASSVGGGVFLQEQDGDVIASNYFEAGADVIAVGSDGTTLPSLSQGPSNTYGTLIQSNLFVVSATATPATILEYGAIDTTIQANMELGGTSACFVDAYNVAGANNVIGNHTSTSAYSCTSALSYTVPEPIDPTGYQLNGTTGSISFVGSLTTTAAASDNVAVTGATSSSHCSLTPTNSSAATNVATTYVSAKAANQVTVTHTATAGMTYDLTCTAN